MAAVVCSALGGTSCWLALGFQDRTQAATGGSGGSSGSGGGAPSGDGSAEGGGDVVCNGGLHFGTPEIFHDQTYPTAITVDPGLVNVYWANSNPCSGSVVMTLAKVDGGLPPSPSVVVGGLGPLVALGSDGTTLWACQQASTVSHAPDGGSCLGYSSIVKIALTSVPTPMSVFLQYNRSYRGIAIASPAVAFGDEPDFGGSIVVLDGTTGQPAPGGDPLQGDAGTIKAIAAEGGPPMFYWQANKTIWGASLGGTPECVAVASDASSMVASHGFLYWTNPLDGTVRKVSTQQPASCVADPTVIASGQASPLGIAVDSTGTNVYWASNTTGGSVLTVPAASSSAVTPATVYVASSTGQPASVATDDSFVYATIAVDNLVVAVPILCK
jgi:hypothetical protein